MADRYFSFYLILPCGKEDDDGNNNDDKKTEEEEEEGNDSDVNGVCQNFLKNHVNQHSRQHTCNACLCHISLLWHVLYCILSEIHRPLVRNAFTCLGLVSISNLMYITLCENIVCEFSEIFSHIF